MRILGISTIRADYDLMSGLYRQLADDIDIDFRLLVSGAHLSRRFGYGYTNISKDGFTILTTIESLIDGDTRTARAKTASILFQNSIDPIANFSPDLILCAGDREDTLMMAIISAYLRIPMLHFFGGDHVQDGHVDNPVRHAISKLATAHFVCTKRHADRLRAMGENPQRIFTIGSIALDRFLEHSPLPKDELIKQFPRMSNWQDYALVIFHPISNDDALPSDCLDHILKTLESREIKAFVGYPNTDPNNQAIISLVDSYNANINFIVFKNLERNIFLSIFKKARFIIGNSSAGILEAASVPIPAINVGLRQVGRDAPENVVFTGCSRCAIEEAIDKVTAPHFLQQVSGVANLYGDGKSVKRAYQLIKAVDFKSLVDKKEDPIDA